MNYKIRHFISSGLLWALLLAPTMGANVHYSGQLIAGACDLEVNGDTIATVDFHTVSSGSFAANGQSAHIPFTLSLKNCHTALATGVLVTFSGTEDSTLPGLLALEPSSEAGGFAIGVETAAQQRLDINAAQGTAFMLTEGVTTINLQAWLQKYAGEDVTPGEFLGSATVSFEYQ
ncbi:fimbrial protein SteF [Salmonella enterica subsp. salamae]|nr:fimbrial protein SteF [Salmonella enterica subsp. salamae]ECJ2281762.1 fimbrial protein SteF [Salmonella enterica subsp. salamae]